MFFPSRLALVASALISHNVALQATDSYSGADLAQSGYLPDNSIEPTVIGDEEFASRLTSKFNPDEEFYAEPLVYTPEGGVQLLFLASSQNWIRVLDARTSDILYARQVQTPFMTSDVNSTEYGKTVGITGTPVLDPTTDIVYFFAKSYIPDYRTTGETGPDNGVYYFYAVDINTLEDVPGFPILVDAYSDDDDPDDFFSGGLLLQNPSLVQVDDLVYGGFGGHGGSLSSHVNSALIIGVNVTSKEVVTNFPVQSSFKKSRKEGPFASGAHLSTDGKHIFLVSSQEHRGPRSRGSFVQDESFVSTAQPYSIAAFLTYGRLN